ncbi:MAG: epoxyqueuosine reductase QueH [Clostridiales Family XIII bacterium]|jgi:predicted adenine nucleotide alpha hydrolase (AANH) superfamily ATPase|nr:epoxyqueuosine reductase QueH [Clostridiales Family XIII bacterium]
MDDEKRACGVENTINAGNVRTGGVFERFAGGEEAVAKQRLLLHSCCGPCSTAVVERLAQGRRIAVFFYNPNITDKEEYERRKGAQLDFIEQYNRFKSAEDTLDFIEGAYEPLLFEEAVRGFEDAPEGGPRCLVCFRLRLEKAAETAAIGSFDSFATTLTVSPHKDCEAITRIGMRLGMRYHVAYHAEDFKKKNGYRRSVELSKKYGLYRQNSCGCCFAGKKSAFDDEIR